MDVIDAAKAVELIEKAVEQNGADYVDPYAKESGGCRYAHDDGTPGCIVGTAYFIAGATVEQLVRMDGDLSLDIRGFTSDELPAETARDAREVFAAAQEAQDHGKTWGEALDAARKAAAAEVAA
jgi:hypothetical protein